MKDEHEQPLSEDLTAESLETSEKKNDASFDRQKLEAELQEHKEKYLRSLAELENTRKRLQKERQEMTRFAVDNVIADFLDPLDSLEKALSFTDQMSPDTRNWAMGFTMILTQLKDVLTQHGVHPFISVGQPFNPHLHEAVSIEETSDKKDGYILEEFSKGYKSGERVLRPARVKVAKHPQQSTPSKNTEETTLNEEETTL
jgi:molecular chaperone GrpE